MLPGCRQDKAGGVVVRDERMARTIKIIKIIGRVKMVRVMKVGLISTCDISSVGSSVASNWKRDLLLVAGIVGISGITLSTVIT